MTQGTVNAAGRISPTRKPLEKAAVANPTWRGAQSATIEGRAGWEMAMPAPMTTVMAKSTGTLGPTPRRAPPAATSSRPAIRARRAPRIEISSEPRMLTVARSRIGSEERAPIAPSLNGRLRWMAGSSGGTASSVRRTEAPASQSSPIRTQVGFSSAPRRPDRVQGLGILERGQVARRQPQVDRLHDPAQDLGVPGPGQVGHEMDRLGSQRLTHVAGDQVLQFLHQGVADGGARPGHHEDDQRLTLDLIGDADGGCLLDRRVANQDRLHLGRPQPLAGDLERVVGAAEDVPKLVAGIDVGPVAVDPDAFEAAPVGGHVALTVLPEAVGHAHPGPPA